MPAWLINGSRGACWRHFWLALSARTSLLRPLACQRAPANVAAAERALPVDNIDSGVCPRLCLCNARPHRGDAQDATADSDDLTGSSFRSGMEDLYAGKSGGLGETMDDVPFFVSTGITSRRHHDCERRVVAPAQVDLVQHPVPHRQ